MRNQNNNNQEECNFLDFYINESLQNQPHARQQNRFQGHLEDDSDEFPFRRKSEATTQSNHYIEKTKENNQVARGYDAITTEKIESINNLLKNIAESTQAIKNLISLNEDNNLNFEQTIKVNTNYKQNDVHNEVPTFEKKVGETHDNIIAYNEEPPVTKEVDEVPHLQGREDEVRESHITKRASSDQTIKGIFDGEKMIGENNKQYSMAANYISKSKLVQGDQLKLSIKPDGTFVYKQISKIERISIISRLEITPDGKYFIVSQDQQWRVLKASITYYKGNPGDQVIALIPKDQESTWAAVVNIQ